MNKKLDMKVGDIWRYTSSLDINDLLYLDAKILIEKDLGRRFSLKIIKIIKGDYFDDSSVGMTINHPKNKIEEEFNAGQWIKISSSLLSCKKCGLINEWAKPNQKDGSYICYNCRS